MFDTVHSRFLSTRGAMALAAVLLLLLLAVFWLYRAERDAARMRAWHQLTSIVRIKEDQIAAWRTERGRDAILFAPSTPLGRGLLAYLSDAANEPGEQLRSQLDAIRERGRYTDLLLVDKAGWPRFSISGDRAISGHSEQTVLNALRTARPMFTPILPGPSVRPHLSLVVPLMGQKGQPPVGAVVLVCDGALLLDPVLHGWSKPSKTMEVVMVRRHGGQVELLTGELPADSAGPSRLVPEETGSLATLVLGGAEGLIEGADQRGVSSLAVATQLADFGWHLIVKDETATIFGAWRFRAALLMLLFALAAGGVGGLGLFIWQYRQKAYYRALYTAEAHLRCSMEHHRVIVQAIGDGIIVTDGGGRIEVMNPAAETLTEWQHGDGVGRPIAEVMRTGANGTGTDAAAQSFAGLADATAPEGGIRAFLVTRNGTVRAIVGSASPLHDDRGALTGEVVVFRDQTEENRRQQIIRARLALREFAFSHTVDQLKAEGLRAIGALVDGMVGPDPPGGSGGQGVRVHFESPGWRQETKSSALHSDSGDGVPGVSDTRRPIVHNPGTMPHTGQAADQGGNGTRGRSMLVPVLRAGRVVTLVGVHGGWRDYTDADAAAVAQLAEDIYHLVEQKTMEEALLASERRYRTLYRSMMDAFVVTDLAGNIMECNDAYAAMLGYRHDELLRMQVSDLTPQRWLAYEQDHIQKQLLHTGCSSLYEKQYLRRNGQLLPVELRTFLILDNDGNPVGKSAVVRDVTERKQAEAEREELQEQLHQARKMESVGQLAGGVAHDFNNMLSVILGYAELAVRATTPADPLHRHLQEIVRAARRSADITRQLLAFARKQTIAPKILDLNDTLGSMLNMLNRLIGDQIELVWHPGRNLWPVRMDPSQVDQLLANLCVNARDALVGRGKITIETGNVSLDAAYCAGRSGFVPGDFVLLVVSDNGCGMEKDMLDKIFEPFFTTKGIGEGTGLGLATVYGIVRQNEGFINVYSEPGEGTTFRLYLPRASGPVESARNDDGPVLPQGQGETVLVVEDDESILVVTEAMLVQLGYTVLKATTPEQALDLARTHTEDLRLVLTDVIMPAMNGRDLVEAVRAICPGVGAVYVSGYTANVIAHRGVLERDVCFLPKPFSISELAAKVREELNGAG